MCLRCAFLFCRNKGEPSGIVDMDEVEDVMDEVEDVMPSGIVDMDEVEDVMPSGIVDMDEVEDVFLK
jgi:hypothetical protein